MTNTDSNPKRTVAPVKKLETKIKEAIASADRMEVSDSDGIFR
jgi:hypothetical protein